MHVIATLLIATSLASGAQADGVPPTDSPPTGPLAEAKTILATEDWKAAANAFLKFLRKQPGAPEAAEATFWAGYSLVKAGDFEQAIQALLPFEDRLADDKWADDALLQLGHAYQGAGEGDDALECWKRLVEKYPTSVWRNETLLNIVSLLYSSGNFADCFPYCERVMKEITDPNGTWETRYTGAYCLNALRRFDEADQWIERWFDPMNPLEEAWRTVVLGSQRQLLEGKPSDALQVIESLQSDFTDLDAGQWLDVLLRSSQMLRQNGRADYARSMLDAALPRLAGQPDYQVHAVLDELAAVIGPDKPQEFHDELARLVDLESTSATVRVLIRDRHVDDLRKTERSREAAELLRRALESEQAEFPRFRAAMLLSEVLADDLNDREAAVKLLDELLPTLKRRDFSRGVRERLQEYRTAAGGK
jgi:tetratricopeptide (TPR) repeat protein